jgi:hypothetical protein
MTKKCNKNMVDQAQAAGVGPKMLKRLIRQDMREIYKKKNSIDVEEIISRFLPLHPEKAEYISSVVNG